MKITKNYSQREQNINIEKNKLEYGTNRYHNMSEEKKKY